MKILTIQNRMGIGDMVIFLPFIEAIAKKFAVPVSVLVKEKDLWTIVTLPRLSTYNKIFAVFRYRN